MTHWNTAICSTNGIEIHYIRTGVDKPTLIFLHGLIANGACWVEIARLLEKDYDIILPDARGHGKSGVPHYGYAYHDHANDVICLIHSLHLTSPVLIGHSMGGMTAALVASKCPKLLSGLVLADPSFLDTKYQREVRDSDVSDQHRRMLHQSFKELVRDAQHRHPHRSREVIESIARARLQTSMAAFDVLTPPNPDFKKVVCTIEVPSLLLFGDRGVVSFSVAEELQQLNPKFQVEKIQDAGHGLHFDQPERFVTAVRSFLRSIQKR